MLLILAAGGPPDPLAFLAQPVGYGTAIGFVLLLLVGPVRLKRELDREVEARAAETARADKAEADATRWQAAHADEVTARQFAERAAQRMMDGESLTMKVLEALAEARQG